MFVFLSRLDFLTIKYFPIVEIKFREVRITFHPSMYACEIESVSHIHYLGKHLPTANNKQFRFLTLLCQVKGVFNGVHYGDVFLVIIHVTG